MMQAPIAVPTPIPALLPVLRADEVEFDAVGLAEMAVWIGVAVIETVVGAIEIAMEDVGCMEDVCVDRGML